jgi:hypothetical protein
LLRLPGFGGEGNGINARSRLSSDDPTSEKDAVMTIQRPLGQICVVLALVTEAIKGGGLDAGDP